MNGPLWVQSVAVALGACLVALLGGLTQALALVTGGPLTRRIGWILGAIALALPPFLTANCWLELTANWRTVLGAERSAIGMLPVTALVLGLGLWPLTLFLVLGSWQRLPPTLLEAEPRLRGSAVLRWVLWPLARNALKQASVLTLTLALANFTVPTLFQVRVFTEEFWLRYNTQFDLYGALVATWPLWLSPVILGWVFRGREVAWPHEAIQTDGRRLAARLGRRWVWSVRGISVLFLILSLALPLAQLLWRTRTWTEMPGALAAGWLAVENSFRAAAGASLGIVALMVVVGMGAPSKSTSHGMLQRSAVLLAQLAPVAWILFLLPGVFLGAAMIWVFNRPGWNGWYASFGMVWLALALRYLALARTGVAAADRAMDPSLRDSARVLGARRWNYFRLVTWPQCSGTLLATTYAIYLLCLWDVETLVLIQPPGGETLALRIFNLLHYGHAAQVNALCVITLGLALLPLLAAGTIAWWLGRTPSRGKGTGIRSALTALFLGTVGVVLNGCSDSNVAEASRKVLDSQFFSAVEVIGSRGVAPGQFNKPRSLACDREDNLYVADVTGRIQKFSPEGRFLLQWQMPQTDLGKAKGMSTDPAGNILVVEPHYQRVNHFNGDGRLVAQWGRRGTNAGEFILPRCIAVNSAGEYYLGEYTTVERVQRFVLGTNRSTAAPVAVPMAPPTPFTLVNAWGHPGQANGELNRAEGIAIGPGDSVYVADSCNHRIQVFDRDGHFLRAHGQAGGAAGRLSFPYDIRVEPNGTQWVCEFGNSRISVFDGSDRLVETIGRAGRAPGEFANPWAICLDSHGNLYVADSQNHRVQKLLRRPRTFANSPPAGPRVPIGIATESPHL